VTPHNTSPSERQGLTSRTAPPRGGGHKSVAMTTRSSSPTGGSPVNNYEPRTLTEAALIAAAARITGDRTVRAVSLNRVVANAERHAAERTPDADYRDVWKQDRPVHPIWAALHEADQKRQHRHSTLVHHEVWGRLERAIGMLVSGTRRLGRTAPCSGSSSRRCATAARTATAQVVASSGVASP
jgi:hypothetical protein